MKKINLKDYYAHISIDTYIEIPDEVFDIFEDDVNLLLDATTNLKYKAIFSTMYSSGLRVSEVLHLHYNDISRSKMQIYIRQSKSRSDRYTILSPRNLEIHTSYWFACGKPTDILFPSRNTKSFLSISAVAMVLRCKTSELPGLYWCAHFTNICFANTNV